MEENFEQEEIRPLIFNYVFHFILFVLIFLLHLIITFKLYWVYKILYKLNLFGTYIGILYFLFPIFPIIIIIWKKFKKKIFQIMKKLTLVFLILSIIIGLLISAIVLINTLYSITYCKECPFSITIFHLNYIFLEYYNNKQSDDDLKELCKSRRCVLDEINNNDKYSYKYLCNYDPTNELYEKDKIYKKYSLNGKEITSINQIICNLVPDSYFSLSLKHNELYNYLMLCNNYIEFYYCERFDKPEKEYEIEYGETCPEENYLLLSYILCVLIILIDIVITMLPWGVEYISLKRILRLMNVSRRKPNSHNSTQKSSVVTNNEESFKKSKTEVIIVPSNNEENIISVNRRKLKIQDDDTINNEENRKTIQPIKIIQNSERTKINNSINVFGKNEENVPTEMNNQNINNNLRNQIEIITPNGNKKK
jgi:hypothetical protein